jgi:thiol-disulfide isomerase/thioredoxin
MFTLTKNQKVAAAAVSVLLLVVLVSVWLFKGVEKFSSPVVVEYYYMNGCPWCEKFMPEWDNYQQQASAKGISCKKIEASDAGDDLSKYNIQGFPTVMIIRDGLATEYKGERTAAALMQATDISASVGPGETLAPVDPRADVMFAH